jgi:hypothetical protein
VIVAVAVVRMMQPAIDEITDVATVRDGLVPTARTMDVVRVMAQCVGRHRGAGIRVVIADLDDVLVDMVAVRMVQMSVVQVVDVVAVSDGGVSTAGAVFVVVVGVMGFRAAHL